LHKSIGFILPKVLALFCPKYWLYFAQSIGFILPKVLALFCPKYWLYFAQAFSKSLLF